MTSRPPRSRSRGGRPTRTSGCRGRRWPPSGAGRTARTSPAPAPVALVEAAFAVGWNGQDGQTLTGPGDVHLPLSGLPAGRTVTAAQLSDGTLNTWDFASPGTTLADSNPNALPLASVPPR